MRFTAHKGKFNNTKVETAEGVFDSQGEWKRWLVLKDEERQGRIRNLQRQVKYVLIPTQYRTEFVRLKTKTKAVRRVAEREITYTADFVYEKHYIGEIDGVDLFGNEIRTDQWQVVVEDFKGFPNDRWPLKKSMMLYFHGIAVREVKKPTDPV